MKKFITYKGKLVRASDGNLLTMDIPLTSSEGFRVRFIDYDGEVLKTEYVPNGGSATAPTLPTHDGLTFQAWNNDFDNITANKDIGACWTTTSGAIEIDTWLPSTSYGNWIKYSTSTVPLFSAVPLMWAWGGSSGITTAYIKLGPVAPNPATRGKLIITPTATLTLNGDSSTNISCVTTQTATTTFTNFNVYSFSLCATSRIGNRPFYGLHFRSINIPVGVPAIGDFAFGTCSSLKAVILPNSLQSIGGSAFYNCYGLSEVILPNSLQSIGDSAFRNCYTLETVVITRTDDLVTLTNSNAFTGAYPDYKIYVPDALVDDYKDATNWVNISARIYPMSDLEA